MNQHGFTDEQQHVFDEWNREYDTTAEIMEQHIEVLKLGGKGVKLANQLKGDLNAYYAHRNTIRRKLARAGISPSGTGLPHHPE